MYGSQLWKSNWRRRRRRRRRSYIYIPSGEHWSAASYLVAARSEWILPKEHFFLILKWDCATMLTYILNHSKASQARRVSARLLISIAGSNCFFLFPWLQLQLLHLLVLLLLLLMPSPFSCNLKPRGIFLFLHLAARLPMAGYLCFCGCDVMSVLLGLLLDR